jgi:hypothetical protein
MICSIARCIKFIYVGTVMSYRQIFYCLTLSYKIHNNTMYFVSQQSMASCTDYVNLCLNGWLICDQQCKTSCGLLHRWWYFWREMLQILVAVQQQLPVFYPENWHEMYSVLVVVMKLIKQYLLLFWLDGICWNCIPADIIEH